MNLNVKHHFAQVNGINLHYTKQGKGKKLVVLLHGWPEFWYSWRYQIPALAEDFTVIAPDLRGFADSDKPLDIKEYHPSIVASDIAKLIASLGFEKAFIVGHDWGGAIAWAFASYYPDLTEKLVVLNCPHPQLFVKALSSNMEQIKKSWYMFFFQIPKVPELFFRQYSTVLF
jgi:pimeloyl-ACP methyl ester carboxylesterase